MAATDITSPAFLAAVLPGAALLWSGVRLGTQLRGKPNGQFAALVAVVSLLLATGIWWPGHLANRAATGSTGDESYMLGTWLGALALALMVQLSAGLAITGKLWRFGVALLVTLVVAYGHAAYIAAGTPGIPPALALWGTTGVLGALAAFLVDHMVAASQPMPTHRGNWVHLLAALVVACMLSLPMLDQPRAAAWGMAAWVQPEGLLAWAMALMGAVLYAMASRQPEAAVEAQDTIMRPLRNQVQQYDNLTRLPSRHYFEQKLAIGVGSVRKKNGRLALLFIDLDGFKPVNDTFGHGSGDRVLKEVGVRLRALTRKRHLVARVGGDEFLMLIGPRATDDDVKQLAGQVIASLSEPFAIEDREVNISCSIGAVFFPDSPDPDKLIARADAAMYAAKRAGGACYRPYTQAMDEDQREQFDLLADLRNAVSRNELELYYQPKIDATSGKVTAAEALLRWNHPTRGQVGPDQFVPLAERFGLIQSIGDWVIEDACRQARVWRERGLRMRVAINLSSLQLQQPDIVERITGALAKYHIQPSLLTCEITESVAMEDTRATQNAFQALGKAGIHLSIDDFGTGYSSLSLLRKLPAEELKIERSFVKDIEHSADARAVVDAVVKLAHSLGLRVVAEGVENQRQQALLAGMGCDELQGYLFARPMTARALLLWAMDDRRDAAVFRSSLFGVTVDGNTRLPGADAATQHAVDSSNPPQLSLMPMQPRAIKSVRAG